MLFLASLAHCDSRDLQLHPFARRNRKSEPTSRAGEQSSTNSRQLLGFRSSAQQGTYWDYCSLIRSNRSFVPGPSHRHPPATGECSILADGRSRGARPPRSRPSRSPRLSRSLSIRSRSARSHEKSRNRLMNSELIGCQEDG